jgi:hypothetical protein
MIHTADSFEKVPFVEAVFNRKFMPRSSPLADHRRLRLRLRPGQRTCFLNPRFRLTLPRQIFPRGY